MAVKRLANSFAALELDVEDENGNSSVVGVSAAPNFVKNNNRALKLESEKNRILANEQLPDSNKLTPAEATDEFSMPLVWIDLEMTGLDVSVDRILEIACIVTDGNLTNSVEGPDLVIHQSKECLDKMGEWCQEHHGSSGLTQQVLQSNITERQAEKQVIDFITEHVRGSHQPNLAGNSVYVDLLFMKKYMPELASLFSHVVVDVSSIKVLCRRWYPNDSKKAPSKENNHRAMDDIRESIKELKFYKRTIFKGKHKR